MILGLTLAWRNRFILDDAFISFVYAKSLVQGQGLTWFGTRVEGYSNFLWVLWIALGERLGANPIMWAFGGSIVSFLAAIFALWRLTELIFDSVVARLIPVVLFVTNYTVVAYATSGLETMLQTALLTIAMWQLVRSLVRQPTASSLATFSLVLGMSVLTRIDSMLPAGIMGLWIAGDLARRKAPVRHYLLMSLPFLAIVVPWAIWKQAYYGRILPNSYYVKVANAHSVWNGLVYIGRFLHWYLIWPVVIFSAVQVIRLRRRAPGRLWVPSALMPVTTVLVAWLAYVVFVGGDFMEFRFLVPITPLLFTFIVYLLVLGSGSHTKSVMVFTMLFASAWLIGASYLHSRSFHGMTTDKTLDSISTLGTFYGTYAEGREWSWIGKPLGEALDHASVVIATSASGAIPYYSGIKTIDMCGLNDLLIPFHGARPPRGYRRPGHQRLATLDYLQQNRVNLVVGHPQAVKRGFISDPRNSFGAAQLVDDMLLKDRDPIGPAIVVAMPLSDEWALPMWYLTPHPRIDELVASGRWEYTRTFVSR